MQCLLSSPHYQRLAQKLCRGKFVRGSQQGQEATVKMEAVEGILYLVFWRSAHGNIALKKVVVEAKRFSDS